MDSSNNKVSNILDTNNWSDSLLIKDEKGNLGYLKPKQKKDSIDSVSKIDHVSEGSIAPQEDSFLALQNISGSSQDKSELVFHPSDKEELNFFAKNIPHDDSKKYSIEKIVERIIEKQNLELDDKNKKIFSNILYNFFRNRKSTIITRELLTNNVLVKNKKLAVGVIDTILSVIKGIKNKIDLKGGLVVNEVELKDKAHLFKKEEKAFKETKKSVESSREIVPEAEDKLLSAQDEIKVALGGLDIPKEEKEEPKIETVVAKDDELEEKLKQSKVVKESKVEEKKEISEFEEKETKKPAEGFSIPSFGEDLDKKEEKIEFRTETKKEVFKSVIKDEESKKIETFLPKVSRMGVNQASKKTISDVITPVKEESKDLKPKEQKSILTGSVQELGSFDLVGFRRLGNTVKERTQKILDKINLLEQESYTKKAQGIAAWRSSEAYKLYLQLGAESMIAGKEVAVFIAEQKANNKETFSIEEFSAISDLNKQLRF